MKWAGSGLKRPKMLHGCSLQRSVGLLVKFSAADEAPPLGRTSAPRSREPIRDCQLARRLFTRLQGNVVIRAKTELSLRAGRACDVPDLFRGWYSAGTSPDADLGPRGRKTAGMPNHEISNPFPHRRDCRNASLSAMDPPERALMRGLYIQALGWSSCAFRGPLRVLYILVYHSYVIYGLVSVPL